MTTSGLTPVADSLRSALESGDFARAEAAFHSYLAWFRSNPRTLAEIECARELFNYGVRIATLQKARLAADLALTKRVSGVYVPARRPSTWRLDG